MIKCNHCGAKNVDGAKICAVCGKEIEGKERFIGEGVKTPWYGATWFIIVMLIVFWPVALYLIWKYKPEWITSDWFTILWLIIFAPVGLYLMWKNRKFSSVARVIITIAVSVILIWAIYYGVTHPVDTKSIQSNKKYNMKLSGITTEEIGNIEFKVPEYYDVRVTNDEVYNVYFYPEREDAQASLGFILMNQNYSAEQVKNSNENIINNWKQTFANIQTEEEERDGNYILKATGSRDGAKMNATALVNDLMKKTVIVILSVDDTDTTGINYFNDFDNMIQNCKFLSNSIVNNESKETNKLNKKNGWIEEGGSWYYYENDKMQKSKFIEDYYVDSDGKMLSNTTKKIKGKNYRFESDGKYKIVEDLELVGGIQGTTSRYDGYFASYISGVVRNNTDKKYSYIQITFDLYDKSGNKVGTALANENNIGPGETWKFEAIALEDFSDYKLDEIIVW